VPELAKDPDAMVAGEELERARLLGVGTGDEVLDDAEALDRAADLPKLRGGRRFAFQSPSIRRASDI